MKVIRAVRTSQGNVVQKMPAGGVGRLRCPRCNGVCTATNYPNGKRVLKCGGPCGGSYVVGALSNPKMPQPGAIQPHSRTTHHHPAPRPAASPTPRPR
jgi:hypothetical protein